MEQTPKSPKFFTKLGILVGFITEVVTAIFMQMSDADLQYWIGKKELIRKQLRETFNQTDLYTEEREVWRKIYQKYFSLDVNLTEVRIPTRPSEGRWLLIIVWQGLTMNLVYDCMSKAFKCCKYKDDLDVSVTKNARTTSETYAIWVRSGVGPDEKYLGKSANLADPDMELGMTLLERILLEIVYFDKKGKHLDIVSRTCGWTLCTASRFADGDVPRVYFFDVEWRVDRSSPDLSEARSGIREVVS